MDKIQIKTKQKTVTKAITTPKGSDEDADSKNATPMDDEDSEDEEDFDVIKPTDNVFVATSCEDEACNIRILKSEPQLA